MKNVLTEDLINQLNDDGATEPLKEAFIDYEYEGLTDDEWAEDYADSDDLWFWYEDPYDGHDDVTNDLKLVADMPISQILDWSQGVQDKWGDELSKLHGDDKCGLVINGTVDESLTEGKSNKQFVLLIGDGNGAASRGMDGETLYTFHTTGKDIDDAINNAQEEIRGIDRFDDFDEDGDESYSDYFNAKDPGAGDIWLIAYLEDDKLVDCYDLDSVKSGDDGEFTFRNEEDAKLFGMEPHIKDKRYGDSDDEEEDSQEESPRKREEEYYIDTNYKYAGRKAVLKGSGGYEQHLEGEILGLLRYQGETYIVFRDIHDVTHHVRGMNLDDPFEHPEIDATKDAEWFEPLNESLTEAPDKDGIMTDDELDAEEQRQRDEFEAKLKAKRAAVADQRKQRDEKEALKAELEKKAQGLLSQIGDDWFFEHLFDILVPASGKADTYAGELIRAVNKIEYRWYNDGDKFFEGYGIETAGQSAYFLMHFEDENGDTPFRDNIVKFAYDAAYRYGECDYDTFVENLKDDVVDYIKNHKDLLGRNDHKDMLDTKVSTVQDEFENEEMIPYYDLDTNIPDDLQKHLEKGNIDDSDIRSWIEDEISNRGGDLRKADVLINRDEEIHIEGITKDIYEELNDNLDRWLDEWAKDLTEEHGDPYEDDDDSGDDEPMEDIDDADLSESLKEDKSSGKCIVRNVIIAGTPEEAQEEFKEELGYDVEVRVSDPDHWQQYYCIDIIGTREALEGLCTDSIEEGLFEVDEIEELDEPTEEPMEDIDDDDLSESLKEAPEETKLSGGLESLRNRLLSALHEGVKDLHEDIVERDVASSKGLNQLFGYVNGSLEDFNPSDLVNKVKEQKRSLHTNRMVKLGDDELICHHIVVDVLGFGEPKVFVDVVEEKWTANEPSTGVGDMSQDRIVMESCGEGDAGFDKAVEVLEKYKADTLSTMTESLKEDADKPNPTSVTKWWKDVEKANEENNWGFQIDNGDYTDIEGMHSAMFDMLSDLRKLDNDIAHSLYKRGKQIYNATAVSQLKEAKVTDGDISEALADLQYQIIDGTTVGEYAQLVADHLRISKARVLKVIRNEDEGIQESDDMAELAGLN